MFVCVHLFMHACVSVYDCMCMYVCVYMCVHVCVCVHVCTGGHPDRCMVRSCLSVGSTLWIALVHRSGLLPPLVNCLTYYFYFGLMVGLCDTRWWFYSDWIHLCNLPANSRQFKLRPWTKPDCVYTIFFFFFFNQVVPARTFRER